MKKYNKRAVYILCVARTINASFPDDEKELYEFVVKQSEEGEFANKSHVIRVALRRMMESEGQEYLV